MLGKLPGTCAWRGNTMERLKERLAVGRQALHTLREILSQPKTPVVRDATIQRFEYTFEAIWRAVQLYLNVKESLETGSPKSAIRGSFRIGLLSEEQARQAMAMADDRNLTVHTYNESLAEQIYSRMGGYSQLMEAWLSAMERGISQNELD
jgi:nucleotidyltransferase substrate binding protein (TIGR01987 family)